MNLVMRGSHTYDTDEMAKLIDGTVYEAKELGIETMTPEPNQRNERKMGYEDWRKDLKVYSLTIWSTATLQEVQTATDTTFSMVCTEKNRKNTGL